VLTSTGFARMNAMFVALLTRIMLGVGPARPRSRPRPPRRGV